jgi:predicted lipid-binding transport protein (Tim44 family)
MKRSTTVFLASFLAVGLTLMSMGEADAKRLGGGRSFGSRPSYSEPYRAPSGMNPAAPSQQPGYQAAQRTPASALPGQTPRRNGLMGMLGGLAIGGLLGSLLFGHGFQGLNLLDILLFAGVAFLLFKLFSARRPQPGATPAGGYAPAPVADDGAYQRQSAATASGFNTDLLFGGGQGPAVAASLPADFDQAAFLTGAKAAYARMQQAWDQGDVGELRALATDKMFGELQDQLRQRGSASGRTELETVDLRILAVRDIGSDREASVLFDVMMREDGGDVARVREVWHFVRPRASKQPTWFLDGVQQWED